MLTGFILNHKNMCFIVNPNEKEKKIAAKNIICYKYLNKKTLLSPFQDFKYKLKTLYETEIGEIIKFENSEPRINEGFHSFIKNSTSIFTRGNPCSLTNHIALIPKNSEYYQNIRTVEYVSNQIVILCKNNFINRIIVKSKLYFNIPFKYEKN